MNRINYFIFLIVLAFSTSTYGQGDTCNNIQPFCAGGSSLIFENTNSGVVGETGPNYGCLASVPDPAWYYMQIDQSGDLFFLIEQNTQDDFTGGGLDVDFVAWGPFSQAEFEAGVCGDLTGANQVPGSWQNGDPPINNTTSQGCSYSGNEIESFNIIGATAGEYYIVVITNFSGQAGFIKVEQNNTTGLGVGGTDCSIVNTGISFCDGDVEILDATNANAASYVWYRDGVVLAETGPILSNVVAPSAVYLAEKFNAANTLIETEEFNVDFSDVPIANPVAPENGLICDDNNDGFWSIDLTTLDAEILGAQNAMDYSITYHSSQADADAGFDSLTGLYTNQTAYQEESIYFRIENNANTDCYATNEFVFDVFDTPNTSAFTYEVCDDDNNGFIEFDLASQSAQVLGTQNPLQFNITYHLNQGDADSDTSPLTLPYTNATINNQQIVVRIENIDNQNCYDTAIVDLIVRVLPIANPIADIMICDDNNDGFWDIDLTTLNAAVYGAQNPAGFTITYHPTQADADANTVALAPAYTNPVAYQEEEIFVRIENNIGTQCFATDSFLLDVFDSALPNDYTYRLCDNMVDGDDTNGFVEFDLATITAQVISTQALAQFNLSYHADQANATANTAPLPLLYTNGTINGEQIVVRMENIDNTNCFDTALIDLIVDPLPVVTPVVDLRQCDDDTDGITQFNLTEANILISADSANEVFTYYLSDAEAQGGAVADQIVNFIAYQNPMPLTGIVYTRIETMQGCWRTAQINLTVGATQIPAGFQLDYEVCDDILIDGDNANGVATFDFSDATAQVTALFPVGAPISVTYYTNLADAQAETNAIPDISNHRNDTSPNLELVYIRVDSDDVNACLGLGQHINLTVNPQPLTNPIDNYILCSDTNTASFDLTTKDAEIIGAQTQPILVSYHRSLLDAQNNNAPIASPYDNISNPEVIFVRSQFDDNGNGVGDAGECVRTDMTFELQVIPTPIIIQPDPIRICNNQVNTDYDLTIREAQITGGDATITLAYYETQLDVDNNTPIATPTTYTNTILNRTIIVEATGANTCTSTTTLDLNTILYAPLDLTPDILPECEIDDDGFDEFDLRRREDQILNGLNAIDFVFRYYILEADAMAGNTNNITNPEAFVNTETVMQTIFIRIDPVANECYQIAPLTLQVNRVPEIQLEEEYVLCLDRDNNVVAPEDTTLLPNPPIDTQLNAIDYTFQWYQGDAIPANVIAGETGPTYTPTIPGDYTVVATTVATGCTIPATTTVIGSYPPESITVEVITPAFSENNTIEITVEGIGEYEYNLNDGPWQDSPIFEDLLGGEHTVYVRDNLNCGQVFAVFIVIDYPKFVTPNGDSYNDTWNIKGIRNQPNAKIYIFDRYGKLIKQLSALSDGWDGTVNGNKMPSSDYWFTVEFVDPLDDIMKIFKAHFTLKR